MVNETGLTCPRQDGGVLMQIFPNDNAIVLQCTKCFKTINLGRGI